MEISRWRQPPESGKTATAPEGRWITYEEMPSTHTSLHCHVVFSTKDRRPLIKAQWRERLFAYLGGILNGADAIPEAIGGVEDHVHLLIGLKPTHRLADLIRDLKSVSSRWAHEEMGSPLFEWQEGYGAFSVSPSQRETVCQYILRQEEHHRRRTFQQEYKELLERSGVKFDTRFLW
jgi:putative transposase